MTVDQKVFSVQTNFKKIPILGIVPESNTIAPTSPVNGQLWYDSSVNRFKVYENGSWQLSSLAGAELTANKGATNGYASLVSGTVPIAQIPTGTTSSTVVIGNDTRVANAEQTTNKNAASGYAPLDGATRLPTANLPTNLPASGITGAVAASRYVGATTSGAPVTGTFAVGDFVIDQTGNMYVCTVAGTQGTWLAVLRFGSSATTACVGNDARLSDTRTPSASSITSAMFAAGGIDQAAATGSARTLSNTSTSACAGNDARLSDTRTPTDNTVTSAKIVDGTIVVGDLNSALLDAADGTTSLRKLGYAATNAMPGVARLDQIAAPTAGVSMGSQVLSNLGTPFSLNDAVRLTDLQAAQAGIDSKPSARVVATANVTQSGTQTIDGVAVIAGDRVLCVAETSNVNNGIWVVAAGSWARAADVLTPQAFWMVEEGTNAGSQWKLSATGTITPGSTALPINQWGAAGTVYVGTANRITLTGSQFDIAATYVGQSTITTLGTVATGVWNGTAVAVANGGTGSTTAATARTALSAPGVYTATISTITAGTEFNVVHNLGKTRVIPAFYVNADGSTVELGYRSIDSNTIGVTSDIAYAASALDVVVIG